MSRFMAMPGVLCLLAGMCLADAMEKEGPNAKQPAAKTPAAQTSPLEDFVIGDPLRHDNLTVFPVMSKVPKTEDRYLSLEEGLKAKTVEVYEVGAEPDNTPNPAVAQQATAPNAAVQQPPSQAANPLPAQTAPPAARRERQGRQSGTANRSQSQTNRSRNAVQSADPFGGGYGPVGDVNRLMVVNRSNKPLYLMPGELIYGGRQDRCIAEETIIAANSRPTPIKVFCVEHGRWAMRGEGETAAALSMLAGASGEKPDAQTLKELSNEAKKGKFVAHAGSLSKAGRVAVQESNNQGEVWDKVGKTNAASGVAPQSGAFTANYTSSKVLKKLEDYVKDLDRPVADSKQVVGAIVAINGKVEAVDVFQSTPLFQKLWPKILRSHAARRRERRCEKERQENLHGQGRPRVHAGRHEGRQRKSQRRRRRPRGDQARLEKRRFVLRRRRESQPGDGRHGRFRRCGA